MASRPFLPYPFSTIERNRVSSPSRLCTHSDALSLDIKRPWFLSDCERQMRSLSRDTMEGQLLDVSFWVSGLLSYNTLILLTSSSSAEASDCKILHDDILSSTTFRNDCGKIVVRGNIRGQSPLIREHRRKRILPPVHERSTLSCPGGSTASRSHGLLPQNDVDHIFPVHLLVTLVQTVVLLQLRLAVRRVKNPVEISIFGISRTTGDCHLLSLIMRILPLVQVPNTLLQ
jgi:hypothetical protein